MQILLTSGYTFSSQQRRIDFSGVPGFLASRLQLVVNITAGGRVIYALGDEDAGLAAIAGSVLTFAYDTRSMADGDLLAVLYNDTSTNSASGAATADKQDTGNARLASILTAIGPLGTDATLQLILSAIKAQRAETIWTDDTGTRFIRLDSGGVISWTDTAGNPSSVPGAGARPDSDSGTVVSRSTFRATASGTGFAAGDILDHLVVTDGDAGDLVSNFWINVTGGARITAPSAASITPLTPLPDGAATGAKQDAANTSLASLDGKLPTLGQKTGAGSVSVVLSSDGPFATNLGTAADAAATSDTGSFSLIALFKRGLTNWTTLLARIPALVSGRLPVDGSGVTQPVSATSLPLPSGAATATSQATANASLASIDGKVPALVAGRQPVDGSGVTQPISAAALPLPTNAANQTTLAAIDGKTFIGTQTKASSRSTTPASDLANIEPAGAPITGTSMPAGGTGITGWLSAIWQAVFQRTAWFTETPGTLAANGTYTSPWRDLGAGGVGQWTRYYVSILSPTAGTLYVTSSPDQVTLISSAFNVTAGALLEVPKSNLTMRWQRAVFVNGSTAQASPTTMATSYAAN